MSAGVSGRLMIVQLGGVALVGQIGASLDGTRDVIDLTSLSSEYVKQHAPGDYGWSFSFNGLYDPSESMSATEIMVAFQAATEIEIVFGESTYTTGSGNKVWTASGTFTSMSISADYTGAARVSGVVQINGDVVESPTTSTA